MFLPSIQNYGVDGDDDDTADDDDGNGDDGDDYNANHDYHSR